MVRKASRISRFISAVEDRPIFVGLDVHKKTYSVAVFEPQDGLIETWTCPAGEVALAQQLASLGCNIQHIAYESGPTGFALARALEDAGFKVAVIAASRIPRGYAASAKTDRMDAEKLATYFARGLLRPIAIPTIEQEGYLVSTDAVFLSDVFGELDSGKARRELGWNPRPLRETVRDAIAWFSEREGKH